MSDPRAAYDDIVEELTGAGPVLATSMMGMPSLKVEGRLFAGFADGAMVFKLDGEAHAGALALRGAHLFDPSGRRPMRQWVLVPASHQRSWPGLAREALELARARS